MSNLTKGQEMSLRIPVDKAISLRFILPSHAAELAAVVEFNRTHLARWLPWATDRYDLDGVRDWIDNVHKGFGERRELALSIVQNGEIVGGIGWTNWVTIDNKDWNMKGSSCDIGYWLAADVQGKGIITRSTRVLTDFGFNEIGFNRITIRAEPENKRSWAVPERLGFQYEGTTRHACHWNDRWVNHRVYAMLAEDWKC